MNWIRANYSKKSLSNTAIVETLHSVYVMGVYHIFKGSRGSYFVVFSDQKELLSFVSRNVGKPMILGSLKDNDIKYKYKVFIKGEYVTVYTIARAMLVEDYSHGVSWVDRPDL